MEAFSASLAICAGNSPVPGEFPAQRPVTRSFDVFFDLRLNKRLSKQSWGWWFETLSRPLWRHCNGLMAVFSWQHRNRGPCTYMSYIYMINWNRTQELRSFANDMFKCNSFSKNICLFLFISNFRGRGGGIFLGIQSAIRKYWLKQLLGGGLVFIVSMITLHTVAFVELLN